MVASRRVPVVLFLIADTGGGHRSAANAIRTAMNLISSEKIEGESSEVSQANLPFSTRSMIPTSWGDTQRPWRAEIRDIFQECGRFILRRTVRLYGPTVENTPGVYAGFYYMTNTRPLYDALSVFTDSMLHRGLLALLEEIRPDVIVSVHPLLTRAVLRMVRNLGLRIPFLTVVTDLIKFHRAWAEPGVDLCSVPTEEARLLMENLGMPPQKMRLLGMPIHPKFCLIPSDPNKMREELGLHPNRFTVLVVGGGDGVGGIGEISLALAHSKLSIQLIVVTGRNKALYQELSAKRKHFDIPVKILGFVQNMPDLMRISDVIATKAGPGTIMEALSCGLPIILTSAIPGQEEGNVMFVETNRVGEMARTPEAVVESVARYTQMSADELEQVRDRAGKLSTPIASFQIAQMILNHVPSPRSISPWYHLPPVTPSLWRTSVRQSRRTRTYAFSSSTRTNLVGQRRHRKQSQRRLPFLVRVRSAQKSGNREK
jgi:1,2-diacylglycerol 3-beta-galactosyltransferase